MKSTQRLGIGTRLRECRIKLYLTQVQMADKLDLSTNYYGQIERGVKGLSLKKAILCCEKFGIDLNYLLAGKIPLKSELIEWFQKCPNEKRIYVEQAIKNICELCK